MSILLKRSYMERYEQFLQHNYEPLMIPKDFQVSEYKQRKVKDSKGIEQKKLDVIVAAFIWLHHISNEKRIVIPYYIGHSSYPLCITIAKSFLMKS